MKITNYLLIVTLVFISFFSWANFNVYQFEAASQEQQFKTLISELRCPKCQNNSLADSNAPLASDIKKYIFQSIKQGKTNDEITDFLISRYGQFITYRPRNPFIWILPMAIGFGALLVAIGVIRHKRTQEKPYDESIATMNSLICQYEEEKSQ